VPGISLIQKSTVALKEVSRLARLRFLPIGSFNTKLSAEHIIFVFCHLQLRNKAVRPIIDLNRSPPWNAARCNCEGNLCIWLRADREKGQFSSRWEFAFQLMQLQIAQPLPWHRGYSMCACFWFCYQHSSVTPITWFYLFACSFDRVTLNKSRKSPTIKQSGCTCIKMSFTRSCVEHH
jgi:hypothetical protein